MSFSKLGTTDSAGSTANTNENDGFTPQPVTSKYLSLREHQGVLKDAIGAHPSISMSDTDLPPVKWANAIKGALYEDDGCLGEQQAETPYTTSEFEDQHGDSIATPHDDLAKDERAELRKLFKKSENHDTTDLDGQFKLPVVNGDRLPLLVADEDVLEAAIEMLNEFAYNDASSTTGDVDDDEKNDFVKACEKAGVGPDTADAVLEGYGVPSSGTVPDLKHTIDVFSHDENALEMLLTLEEANKDRKTAKAALNSAIDALDENDDTDDETNDDEGASSTEGGLSDEQIEKVATATATAVASTLSEMDF